MWNCRHSTEGREEKEDIQGVCSRVSEQGSTLGEKIGGKCKIKNDFLYNSKFMLSQNFYVSYNRTEDFEISLLL